MDQAKEGQPDTTEVFADTQVAATQASDSDNEHKIKIDEASSEKLANQKTIAEEGDGQSSRRSPDGQVSSRPHSSQSSARAKSNASGEIVFEAKKKKKRGGSAAPDDAYTVTFTVSIAMAVPTGKCTF